MKIKADYIIVGSGAGGASVARELARAGKNVLVLEKGKFATNIGTQVGALKFYDHFALRSSIEGFIVYSAIMGGGSTVICCGNGMPVLSKELEAFGIDLSEEFKETENELEIRPLPEELIGEGSQLIMRTGNKIGLEMIPMPKFVDFSKCDSCGKCVLGCIRGAKWTAVKYLQEMQQHGGRILYGVDVKKIIVKKGRAVSLIAKKGMKKIILDANYIVLAAGGLATPAILKRSGLKDAGNKLFVDFFNVTFGTLKDVSVNLYKEPTMAVVSTKYLQDKGFLVSPFLFPPLIMPWIMPLFKLGKLFNYRNLLGIMTKIKDDNEGKVLSNGRFYKKPTKEDIIRLNEGEEIATQILREAGVKEKDIFTSKSCGAHPGGTAAIGDVVDSDLMTEIANLFVCDASVLPVSSGAPPIVTIVSLGKRLGKYLSRDQMKR
ncbi:MAG: FAD-dependent oxidoreductase [Candidatus Omnitrophota bacterium]|nr:FAD-dependent oxidoreductase [Candidatus Omnitrophota bacterium]